MIIEKREGVDGFNNIEVAQIALIIENTMIEKREIN